VRQFQYNRSKQLGEFEDGMHKKENLFLSLGAAATLFATPFIMSSCQSAGRSLREDKAMMEGVIVSEKLNKGCRCAEEGKKARKAYMVKDLAHAIDHH
jgi:hypothetical protein